jgi:hypothetical protein
MMYEGPPISSAASQRTKRKVGEMAWKAWESWRRTARAGLLALVALSLAGACGACTSFAATPARAARTFTLNENGNLHLTSKRGFTLNEHGSASGTVGGTIYVQLTIASTNRVTARVSIYPSGGSISGYATADYHRGTTAASFSGTMSVTGGSGHYAHAHGSGLGFSGTIQRSNDAITVHVSGHASD